MLKTHRLAILLTCSLFLLSQKSQSAHTDASSLGPDSGTVFKCGEYELNGIFMARASDDTFLIINPETALDFEFPVERIHPEDKISFQNEKTKLKVQVFKEGKAQLNEEDKKNNVARLKARVTGRFELSTRREIDKNPAKLIKPMKCL